jgi:hypothetical protein
LKCCAWVETSKNCRADDFQIWLPTLNPYDYNKVVQTPRSYPKYIWIRTLEIHRDLQSRCLGSAERCVQQPGSVRHRQGRPPAATPLEATPESADLKVGHLAEPFRIDLESMSWAERRRTPTTQRNDKSAKPPQRRHVSAQIMPRSKHLHLYRCSKNAIFRAIKYTADLIRSSLPRTLIYGVTKLRL